MIIVVINYIARVVILFILLYIMNISYCYTIVYYYAVSTR